MKSFVRITSPDKLVKEYNTSYQKKFEFEKIKWSSKQTITTLDESNLRAKIQFVSNFKSTGYKKDNNLRFLNHNSYYCNK